MKLLSTYFPISSSFLITCSAIFSHSLFWVSLLLRGLFATSLARSTFSTYVHISTMCSPLSQPFPTLNHVFTSLSPHPSLCVSLTTIHLSCSLRPSLILSVILKPQNPCNQATKVYGMYLKGQLNRLFI